MAFNFGAVAGGLGSAFGSLASSALSYKASKRLIKFQQDWQERMSNTAHQREVKDLRAAGLNPILSGMGGSGASFGSASAPAMSFENPAEAGINSARANKLNKAQIENLNTNTESQVEDIHNKIVSRSNETRKITNDIENNTALTNAQIQRLRDQTVIDYMNANTARSVGIETAKYTRERSRGYSEAESQNYGGDFGLSRPNSDKNTKKRGFNIHLGGNYGYSRSRTY